MYTRDTYPRLCKYAYIGTAAAAAVATGSAGALHMHPAARRGMRVTILNLFYYYLLVNCTIERSAASAFIDGVLHRETSNWNHTINDYIVLDSFIDPQDTS